MKLKWNVTSKWAKNKCFAIPGIQNRTKYKTNCFQDPLTLYFIMLQNGRTYFKNLAV